jgi:CRP-like cAMP-binding protein
VVPVRAANDPLPLLFDVHPGREVVRQGEPFPDAWVVRSGALLSEIVDAEGHRLILDVLGPGDLVGGPETATAGDSVRALVPSGLFAAGSIAVRDGLVRRARRAAWLACAIAWDRLPDRLLVRMDDLALRFGRVVPGGRLLELPLTQEHLAALTGSARESVNRALSDLAAAGRVGRSNGRYVVRQAAADPSGSTLLGLQDREGA